MSKLFDNKYDCLSVVVTPQTDNSLLERLEFDPLSPSFRMPLGPQNPFTVYTYFTRRFKELTKRDCKLTQGYQLSYAKKLIKDYGFDKTIRAIEVMLRNNFKYRVQSLNNVYAHMPKFMHDYFKEEDASLNKNNSET